MPSPELRYVARLRCDVCGRLWVGTFLIGEDPRKLQCPSCLRQKSEPVRYYRPSEVHATVEAAGGVLVEYREG